MLLGFPLPGSNCFDPFGKLFHMMSLFCSKKFAFSNYSFYSFLVLSFLFIVVEIFYCIHMYMLVCYNAVVILWCNVFLLSSGVSVCVGFLFFFVGGEGFGRGDSAVTGLIIRCYLSFLLLMTFVCSVEYIWHHSVMNTYLLRLRIR